MVVTNSGAFREPKKEVDTKFIDASLRNDKSAETEKAYRTLVEEKRELEEKLKEKDVIIEKMAREKDFIKRRR